MKHYVAIAFTAILLTSCAGGKDIVDAPDKDKGGKTGELSYREQYKADYMFHEGNRERILGNWERAVELYGLCLEVDEDNYTAMYEMAFVLHKAGKVNEAIGFAKLASNAEPDNAWYMKRHAMLLLKSGDLEAATKVYEEIVKRHPDKESHYTDWAYALIVNAELADAIKVYEKMEQNLGQSPSISIEKYNIFLQLKDRAGAKREVMKLVEMTPKDPQAWSILADLYQDEGEMDKAMEAYEKVLEIDPSNGLIHLSLADYYENKGDRERSHKELRLAFESDQITAETKANILNSYFSITEEMPDLRKFCLELGEIMINMHSDDAQAYTVYGNYMYRENRLDDARDMYRKASALEGSRFMIWMQILVIDTELRDYDALEKESATAMELFPTQPQFYLYNGVAHKSKKQYDKAIESYSMGKELVIDNQPLKAQFYLELGDVYHAIDNHVESDKAYEKSLSIDGGNPYVLNNYSYYLALRKEKLDRAEELAAKAVSLQPKSASYLDTYGYVLYVKGRYEEAKTQLQAALDNGGNKSGAILEHFGDVLFKLNSTSEALKYWEKAKAAGGASDLIDKKIADKKLYE